MDVGIKLATSLTHLKCGRDDHQLISPDVIPTKLNSLFSQFTLQTCPKRCL